MDLSPCNIIAVSNNYQMEHASLRATVPGHNEPVAALSYY